MGRLTDLLFRKRSKGKPISPQPSPPHHPAPAPTMRTLRRSPERHSDLRSFVFDSPRSSAVQLASFNPERVLNWRYTATTRDQMLTRSPTPPRAFTDDEMGLRFADRATPPQRRRRSSSVSSIVTAFTYNPSIESLGGNSGPGFMALQQFRHVQARTHLEGASNDLEQTVFPTNRENDRGVNTIFDDTNVPASPGTRTRGNGRRVSFNVDNRYVPTPPETGFPDNQTFMARGRSGFRVSRDNVEGDNFDSGSPNSQGDQTPKAHGFPEYPILRSNSQRVNFNIDDPYDQTPMPRGRSGFPKSRNNDQGTNIDSGSPNSQGDRTPKARGSPKNSFLRSSSQRVNFDIDSPHVPAPPEMVAPGDPIKNPTPAEMKIAAARSSSSRDDSNVFTSEGLATALSNFSKSGNVPDDVLNTLPPPAATASPTSISNSTMDGGSPLSRSSRAMDTHHDSEPPVVISAKDRDHIEYYYTGLCNRLKANNTTISHLQALVNSLTMDNDRLEADAMNAEEAKELGRLEIWPTVNKYYAEAQSHKAEKRKLHGFVRYIMSLLPGDKKKEAVSAMDGLEIDLADESQDQEVKDRVKAARKELETVKYWKTRALAAEKWIDGVE
ncbi:hypothetical protein BDV96DRAFT_577147 [Lophiotrema nucula]|uniref:Uncharacterized protein n=1 Tax=Lophiotrema nucula TaxID=690887 RepID=A0A6A5Z5C3_9PLEO|nr:hypothetical protein BDV96DRAFT_577147 [Lophiotrema nucula]